MKIPGMQILKKAERKGNEAEVPRTEGLGLVNFLKLTYEEVSEDHVIAYAGNLTYKALFAIFPLFTLLLSLLGLFNATELLNTMLDKLSSVLPPGALSLIEGQLLGITKSQASGAFTLGAVVSILLALWGVPLGYGGDKRNVRGGRGPAFLEEVRHLDLHLPRGNLPDAHRARDRRLRRLGRRRFGRRRRTRWRIPDGVEHSAVADPGLRRAF